MKTPGGYIAKSKSQKVCLQLSQTLGGDYVILPKLYVIVKILLPLKATYLRKVLRLSWYTYYRVLRVILTLIEVCVSTER